MFNPTFWAVTQPLGLNNPIAEFRPYFTQSWIVFNPAFFREQFYVIFACNLKLSCLGVEVEGGWVGGNNDLA